MYYCIHTHTYNGNINTMEMYSTDRNGEICFEEFLWYMAITAPTDEEKQVKSEELIEMCFSMYDVDGMYLQCLYI
jgi:Ca2+-binding EF-hand superfamily protein